MRKISFVWSCFVMTFFVACQQAEVENPKADDLRMSIVASINGQSESPESRYTGTDPSNVVFKNEDKIGVFIDSKPADAWIFDGEDWNSVGTVVYWPSETRTHTFRAFYPYDEANDLTRDLVIDKKGNVVEQVEKYRDGSSKTYNAYEDGTTKIAEYNPDGTNKITTLDANGNVKENFSLLIDPSVIL